MNKKLVTLMRELERKIEKIQKTIFTYYHKNIHIKPENLYKVDSSIITIEDCLYGFSDYINTNATINLYITAYGILQMLYTQSDAFHSLNKGIERDYVHTDKLRSIRELRNLSIGHPTNSRFKDRKCTSIISRATMTKDVFDFLISFEDGSSKCIPCNLIELINTQVNELNKLADDLLNYIITKSKEKLSHIRKNFFGSKFDELKISSQIQEILNSSNHNRYKIDQILQDLTMFKDILKKNHFITESSEFSITQLYNLLNLYDEDNNNCGAAKKAIEKELSELEDILTEIEEKIDELSGRADGI